MAITTLGDNFRVVIEGGAGARFAGISEGFANDAENARDIAQAAVGVDYADATAALASASNGDKFTYWDGDQIVYSTKTGGVLVELAGPWIESDKIGFTQSGASPATRTARDKLRDVRSTADKSGNLSASLASWVTDLTTNAGGKIKVPGGNHTMTSGVNFVSGYDVEGDGRIRTVIDPAFAGTVFSMTGGAAVTPYHNRLSGLGFISPSSFARTLFHVRNAANCEISRMSIPEGGIQHPDSIGILLEGRELNWFHDNNWAIAQPMRILPNPEPTALNITTDYLVCEREHYIAQAATEACVESAGAYLSNGVWRDCALVKGAEGIKLVNTTMANASHNISIAGCRREQGQTASAYSFHFEFGGAGGFLQNLDFERNYTSSAQNGVFGRGVQHALLKSSMLTQGAGKVALDWVVPPGGSLTLLGCTGHAGGTKTIVDGHPLLRVPSRAAGNPIGPLEQWVHFVTPADPGAGGTINYDNVPFIQIGASDVASFEMEAPAGSRTIRLPLVPANTAGVDAVGAEVRIRAKAGRYVAFYPADGSAPVVETATGPFATTATANRIYGYAGGIISNTLAASEVIRVEVRK